MILLAVQLIGKSIGSIIKQSQESRAKNQDNRLKKGFQILQTKKQCH